MGRRSSLYRSVCDRSYSWTGKSTGGPHHRLADDARALGARCIGQQSVVGWRRSIAAKCKSVSLAAIRQLQPAARLVPDIVAPHDRGLAGHAGSTVDRASWWRSWSRVQARRPAGEHVRFGLLQCDKARCRANLAVAHRTLPAIPGEIATPAPDVCFGSKADMCSAKGHVRFTPNSDRESGHRQTVRSALPPKADMCSALPHVCFGPKADMMSLTQIICRLAIGASPARSDQAPSQSSSLSLVGILSVLPPGGLAAGPR